jgi:hypothetical protein
MVCDSGKWTIVQLLLREYWLFKLSFKVALEFAVKRFQGRQEGLQLNGTHKLLVCATADN